MKISQRLISLALLVNSNDIVADIGCDHALLDIYLVKNKIIDKSLACDINLNALNNGIKNIKKYHLDKQINTLISDGITNIPNDINTLILSGMGINTICYILNNDKLNQINKIIIQANKDLVVLRKFLIKKGFYIDKENAILDANKYYINIVFLRGNKKYSNIDLKYGPILKTNSPNYFKYLYENNLKLLKIIPLFKIKKRLFLMIDNQRYKRYIK